MHFYNFHIKDYRAKTAHLTPLEHYIYRTLIDWYYLSEKPFETIEQIARYLLLPLNDENTQAIQNVLDEFFNFSKGKYHHTRINQEIKNYHHKNGNDKVTDDNANSNASDNEKVTQNNGNALSVSERQARYKERKKMLKALLDKGITLDNNASFDEVCNAYNANFANDDNETLTTDNASDNEKVTQNNGKNEARTINHKPITINHKPNNISPQTPQGAGVDVAGTHETTKKTTQKTNPSSDTNKTVSKSKHTAEVGEVFEFWITTFAKDKNKTKLSDIRKRKIIQRLEQGYTVQDIKTAIANCSKSDYHISGGYTDIELICRDEIHLDRFLAMKPKTAQPQFGGANDPLAVNQHWQNYTPPPNRDENFKIAMERLSQAQKNKQPNAPMGMIEI